jgi:putative MATE family efflux protein
MEVSADKGKKKHNKELHVETGPIGRTLFSFALPVIASQLLQEFYSIADCAVIGRFAKGHALAAVGISGLILSVLINFFIGFSSGISIITSRLFGAYDHEKLKDAISRVIRLVLVIGALFTGVMLIVAEPSLSWIHCPEAVNPEALIYLKICLYGLTAQLIYNVGTSVLRSLGDTKTPMFLFLGSVICNLGLDILFVVIFHLGIRGAAIATLASQWLLAAVIMVRLYRLDPLYALKMRGLDISFKKTMKLLRDGIPAGMQALFMSISSLLIQLFINGFGPEAMGGMTVFAKIEGFLYFPAFAYGIALTGFVGQNYGAGKFERIREATKISALVMTALVLPLSFILRSFSPHILKLFTTDPGILSNALEAVRFVFPVYVFYALNQVFLGSVKGLGSTVYPMVCTLVCYSIFRVLWCALTIPHFPTMRMVYLSYDISFVLMLLMLAPVYHRMLRNKELSNIQ